MLTALFSKTKLTMDNKNEKNQINIELDEETAQEYTQTWQLLPTRLQNSLLILSE